MKQSEMKNAPSLGGWAIAMAAGLVASGAAYVVGGFDLRQAVFVGVAVFAVTGLLLGVPWGFGSSPAKSMTGPVAKPAMASTAAPARAADAVMAPVVATPEPMASLVEPTTARVPVSGPAAMFTATPAVSQPAAKLAPRTAKAPAGSLEKSDKIAAPKAAKPAGPMRLTGPRNGRADDLKEIEGVGPALEKLCNSLGFYHFDQIAGWSDADVAVVDAEMKTFKGRIARDKWVSQSKIIVAEGLEAFRIRARTNNY